MRSSDFRNEKYFDDDDLLLSVFLSFQGENARVGIECMRQCSPKDIRAVLVSLQALLHEIEESDKQDNNEHPELLDA